MQVMDFQEVQRRYLELRADFEAGRISEEEFQEEIEGLQVKDEQGVYWTIGAQSGKWYRYDGQEWTQETPISMTKHQGRGIPERVARRLGGPAYEEGQGIPRWLQVGCFGIVLLGVVAALIFFFMMVSGQPRTTRTATPPRSVAVGSPTATSVFVNTPALSDIEAEETPLTLPSASPVSPATPSPTPTPLTFQAYANDTLGVKLDRPGGWQVRESTDQVVLAPNVAGLAASLVPTRALVSSATFVIARQPGGAALNADNLLDELLAELPVEGPTTVRGTRPVYNVDWSISRVQLKAADPNKQVIAYAATALLDGTAYLVWAAAPRAEWTRLEGIYQKMINSLRVTPPLLALASPSRPAVPVGDTPSVTPTNLPTDTPGPAGTPTPIVYVIERGDTLGSIAMKYDVSVEDLQTINNISDPTKLQIGQQLIIPAPGYVPPVGATAQPTSMTEPARTSEPTTPAETVAAPVTEASPEGTREAPEPTPTRTPRPQPTATPAALSGKIVYPVYDPSRMLENQPGSYDIWMSDPQGNNKQVLVSNASQPHLNPGGDLLAYRSWEPQKRGIAFLTIGGGRADLLTSYVEDISPCWDPSSLTIVFPSRREPDRVARLYRIDQTNKKETGLGLIAEYVSTFRDGRLVYKGCSPEGACGIYISGAEGTGATLISSNGGDTAPAPSPDGTRIAFMSIGRDGASNYEIFVMDSSGGNVVRLTNNGAADGLPTWSPDGSTIAWVSNQGGVWAIWAMNADGSNQRQLFAMGGSPDGIVESQHDISRGWLEERIAWGP